MPDLTVLSDSGDDAAESHLVYAGHSPVAFSLTEMSLSICTLSRT